MANTGIAAGFIRDGEVFVEYIKLVQTEKTKNKQVRSSSDTIARCRKTHEFVLEEISTWGPDVIFAETPSGSQSSAAMKSYGITCMLLASITPPPIEVTPIEVKLASVGSKSASKASIIKWASDKYTHLDWHVYRGKLQGKNEHTADAIGVAYAAIKTNQFKQLQKFLV